MRACQIPMPGQGPSPTRMPVAAWWWNMSSNPRSSRCFAPVALSVGFSSTQSSSKAAEDGSRRSAANPSLRTIFATFSHNAILIPAHEGQATRSQGAAAAHSIYKCNPALAVDAGDRFPALKIRILLFEPQSSLPDFRLGIRPLLHLCLEAAGRMEQVWDVFQLCASRFRPLPSSSANCGRARNCPHRQARPLFRHIPSWPILPRTVGDRC